MTGKSRYSSNKIRIKEEEQKKKITVRRGETKSEAQEGVIAGACVGADAVTEVAAVAERRSDVGGGA